MTLVMGILNRTPDSFYDGGRMALDAAVDRGVEMVAEGADIIDIGGVRAGPGPDVSHSEELDRLIPLVETLKGRVEVPLSVETTRPEVARAALAAGASYINDVSALQDPDIATAAAEADGRLILMHHGGQLRGRPRNPRYEDVVASVIAEWQRLEELAGARGVRADRVVVDPGLDFGKNTFHSLELMRRIDELVAFGKPLLIAASRKDIVGETLDLPVGERLEGSLALAALSAWAGAAIVRVHDVRETVRVVRMVRAVRGELGPVAAVRGLWE